MNRLHLIGYLILAAVLMYKEYPMILSVLLIVWGFVVLSGHLDDDKEGEADGQQREIQ